MLDEAVFTQLATDQNLLRRCIFVHLNRHFVGEVDDVVQSALLVVWARRAEVLKPECTRSYTIAVASRMAMKWHIHRERAIGLPGEDLNWTIRWDGLRLEDLFERLVTTESALDTMLASEAALKSADKWAEVLAHLTPLHQKHYAEWLARGGQSETHGQSCKMTRVVNDMYSHSEHQRSVHDRHRVKYSGYRKRSAIAPA